MSRDSDRGNGALMIGGPARANLLPPEVGAAAQGKIVRRNAIVIVIFALIVAILGYVGATVLATSAQVGLDAAKERTTDLISQQTKYSEVKQVTSMLASAAAARQVGMSTEIDWKKYLTDIQKSLPAGTDVTNVVAETATPLVSFNQPVVPLQGDRIGELKFTATSQSLPDVQQWLEALTALPGYVDASPGSVTLSEETAQYEVTITLHIDKDALLNRFDDEAAAARDKSLADKAEALKAAKAKAAEDSAKSPRPTPTPSPSNPDGGE